jgi:general secretion pathway protein A
MDYYRTLKLDREPFSNSPDPGLFFNSRQHLEALQQLEISIRLKRGLSVITGDVGTGKTTLSRQLIQKISYDPGLEYFLILDPGFSSTREFLRSILALFTGSPPDPADDTALKEQIKACLFSRGVDRNTTTILLIDEGQKLPVFCLEVLRELLNYETNDHKLLQIIIFAQKEFEQTIQALDNFNDRIDFRYTLSPLGFFETRQLIRFRLEKSGGHTSPVPPVFSFLAFAAIFRYSRGYPRKIINLCHHVMIRMIIKNRSRAGYFFVIACAREVFAPPRPRRFRPALLAVVLLLLSGGVVLLNGGQISRLVPGILSDRGPQPPAAESSRISIQIPDTPARPLDQASRNLRPAPVLASSAGTPTPGLSQAEASAAPGSAPPAAQALSSTEPAPAAAPASDTPSPDPAATLASANVSAPPAL